MQRWKVPALEGVARLQRDMHEDTYNTYNREVREMGRAAWKKCQISLCLKDEQGVCFA